MFDKPVNLGQPTTISSQHHGKRDYLEGKRDYVHSFDSNIQAGQPALGPDPPRYVPVATATSHMQPYLEYSSVHACRNFSPAGNCNAVSADGDYGTSFNLDGAADEIQGKTKKHRGQLTTLRLPSDQLDRIIAAISRKAIRTPPVENSGWTSGDESTRTLQAWSGATAGSEVSQWTPGEDANRVRNSSDVTMFSMGTGLPVFPRGLQASESTKNQSCTTKGNTRVGSHGHSAIAAIPVTIVSPTPLRVGLPNDKPTLGARASRCDSPLAEWGASNTSFRPFSSLSQKADPASQKQDDSGIVM